MHYTYEFNAWMVVYVMHLYDFVLSWVNNIFDIYIALLKDHDALT